MTDHDASSHVQIMAAYAHAGLGGAEKGVARLAALLDAEGAVPLRFQALSTLTLLGESARAALPSIRRAAQSDDETLHAAGVIWSPCLMEYTRPAMICWTGLGMKRVGPSIGHPMPGPAF